MGKDIELAILFADVVGSTRLFEAMGDLRARDMVSTCIDVMREATEQHSGSVIKTIGDEVMSTFPTADDALNAAGEMQKQIAAHTELRVDGQPVAIRLLANGTQDPSLGTDGVFHGPLIDLSGGSLGSPGGGIIRPPYRPSIERVLNWISRLT